MRKALFLSSVITVVLAFTVGAHASTYTLTISGPDTGSLTVTGTSAGGDPGSLLLASGFGTIDGHSVTLVAAPSGYSNNNDYVDPVSGASFDDELYPLLTPPLDASGLEFTNGAGLYFLPYADNVTNPLVPDFGVLQVNTINQTETDSSGDTFRAALATSTPEPSSVMLLGTGLLGLAGAVRRKLSVNA